MKFVRRIRFYPEDGKDGCGVYFWIMVQFPLMDGGYCGFFAAIFVEYGRKYEKALCKKGLRYLHSGEYVLY